MKNILLLALSLLVLSFVSHAQDAEPSASHLQAAERLLDNMNMQETLDKTIDATLAAQLSQMPQMKNLEGVMRDFFTKYMNYDALKSDYAALYTKHYTEKELVDLLAFYQTPLGKKLVETMPDITAESSLLGQKLVQEHMPELQEAIMKEMAKGADGDN